MLKLFLKQHTRQQQVNHQSQKQVPTETFDAVSTRMSLKDIEALEEEEAKMVRYCTLSIYIVNIDLQFFCSSPSLPVNFFFNPHLQPSFPISMLCFLSVLPREFSSPSALFPYPLTWYPFNGNRYESFFFHFGHLPSLPHILTLIVQFP